MASKTNALKVNDLLVGQVHRSRWTRNAVHHQTVEEIAKHDGVSVEAVKRSIAVVDSHRSLLTFDELESVQIDLITSMSEYERVALRDGLTATKVVKDGRGRQVRVPDVELRLRAVEVINEKIEAIKERDKGVKIFNNQIANTQQVTAPSGAVLFEDRLREKIRQRDQTLALPGRVADPIPGADDQPELLEADVTIETNSTQRSTS